jgi:transcriptional regulator with XRE-family HTH domain
MATTSPVGSIFREWRRRRHVSQLDLALSADVSARHLSFVETGRSHPSREMVLHLAERLDIPLRQRNELLLVAGYAPAFPERPIEDPALAAAREAMERLLVAHEPYPAVAIDRHWNVVSANRAMAPLAECVGPRLRQPPINVLRNSLHPEGLAPKIRNLPDWRAHLLSRLRRQIDLAPDPALIELLKELLSYPVPEGAPPAVERRDSPLVPMQLEIGVGTLNLISTTMVFGTPLDVTLSELALEAFFPADPETAALLRRITGGR